MNQKLGVYIGRFQPFHKGHEALVREALSKFDKVLVLIGSAYRPGNIRNPWTETARHFMVKSCFPKEYADERLHIKFLKDFTYRDELWIKQVHEVVNNVCEEFDLVDHTKILWGHDKDHSSYYLSLFPGWESENAPAHIETHAPSGHRYILSSTIIRRYLFQGEMNKVEALVPGPVFDIIQRKMQFPHAETWERIQDEWDFVDAYQKDWLGSPYPPIFVTTDAIVVCSGHVLLVTRGGQPGKGLLALPGGFIDKNETLVHGVIRELREETRLKMPAKAIEGFIERQHVFDEPHRSTRGRTITHAFYIHLKPGVLPEVRGSDDAESAQWVPLSDITSYKMYEDHYDIIRFFTG